MWGLGFLCALMQLIFLPLHSPFPFKRPLYKETWESYVTVQSGVGLQNSCLPQDSLNVSKDKEVNMHHKGT